MIKWSFFAVRSGLVLEAGQGIMPELALASETGQLDNLATVKKHGRVELTENQDAGKMRGGITDAGVTVPG